MNERRIGLGWERREQGKRIDECGKKMRID
jgi:hypothetical protein